MSTTGEKFFVTVGHLVEYFDNAEQVVGRWADDIKEFVAEGIAHAKHGALPVVGPDDPRPSGPHYRVVAGQESGPAPTTVEATPIPVVATESSTPTATPVPTPTPTPTASPT